MQVMYQLSEYYEDILKLSSADTELEVETLDKIFKKFAVKSVLDIACGVGRHSLRLAKLGYKLTGIDFSPNQINQARKNAEKFKVKVDFLIKNANSFRYKNTFDAAICMWSTISEEPMLYGKVILNTFRALKNNGIFIIDIKNWKAVDRERRTRKNVYSRKGVVLKGEMTDFYTENFRIRREVFSLNGKKYDDVCLTRLLSDKDLIKEMKKVGFKKFRVINDYGSKKIKNPKRFLIIAQK